MKTIALLMLFSVLLLFGCVQKPPTEITCWYTASASHQGQFFTQLINNNFEQTAPSAEFESPDVSTITINPSVQNFGTLGRGENRIVSALVVARANALRGTYAIIAHISNFGTTDSCVAYMTIS